jgi:Alkaline and neutral invertase/Amylo-alpha-1,6-glucosidase
MFATQAIQTIYDSITDYGIMASKQNVGNYARVWSRDSMMTGICGLLLADEKIIAAHRKSIITLAAHQGAQGQIPSNVSGKEVSFGTLVGRVDATTWWLIGILSYTIITKDKGTFKQLLPNINKAFSVLDSWEYNAKGLMYTPLGGNWADEYICDGYTLYDNALRLWALKLMNKIEDNPTFIAKQQQVENLIINNFNLNNTTAERYHFIAYQQLMHQPKPYLPASFNSNGYKTKFDMAGNALAILLGLNQNTNATVQYLQHLAQEQNHWMLPVFHPIITPANEEWYLLENNYNYVFKNHPHHFHNGGSWPVFLGWMGLAMYTIQQSSIPQKILQDYEKILQAMPTINFQEYITTNQLESCGTKDLCFSAIGYLLLQASANDGLQHIHEIL